MNVSRGVTRRPRSGRGAYRIDPFGNRCLSRGRLPEWQPPIENTRLVTAVRLSKHPFGNRASSAVYPFGDRSSFTQPASLTRRARTADAVPSRVLHFNRARRRAGNSVVARSGTLRNGE